MRHRLPTRRAVAGGILIAVAASGVLVAHRSANAAPVDRYVVATRAVPAGALLDLSDLGTVAADLPAGVVAVAAEDAEDLVGRVTRVPLDELALLRPDDLHDRGRFSRPGSVEVVLELSSGRAMSGSIGAGDHVDVLVTDPESTGTHTVAADALVSKVGSDDEHGGIGASDTVQVRLSLVDSDTAAAVVDASIRAEVSLVLPAPTEGDER